jgi:hypothetical protein
MSYPTREMSYFDLSRELQVLEKYGAEVPMRQFSNFKPTFVETREGVEVYRHEGRTLQVHAGEVIDSHGNVVNLNQLERVAFDTKPDRFELENRPDRPY